MTFYEIDKLFSLLFVYFVLIYYALFDSVSLAVILFVSYVQIIYLDLNFLFRLVLSAYLMSSLNYVFFCYIIYRFLLFILILYFTFLCIYFVIIYIYEGYNNFCFELIVQHYYSLYFIFHFSDVLFVRLYYCSYIL